MRFLKHESVKMAAEISSDFTKISSPDQKMSFAFAKTFSLEAEMSSAFTKNS
jgi:hypothetical protein